MGNGYTAPHSSLITHHSSLAPRGRPLRLLVLFVFVCACAGGLAARLTYWQVLQAAPLQKQLTGQLALDEQVPARRGSIRDVQGDLLAGNLSVDYVYAQPNQIKQPEEVAARLAPVLEVAAESLLPILADKNRSYVRLLGGRKLHPDKSEQVAQLRIPGIFLEP